MRKLFVTLLFSLLAITLFLSSTSALVCYQESANVSNQTGKDNCAGLNYGGNYSIVGSLSNPSNCYDGNWNTYCASGTTDSVYNYIYINYSIPIETYSAWNELSQGTFSNAITNNTILSSCLSGQVLMLRIGSRANGIGESQSALDCLNATAWKNIFTSPSDLGMGSIFEEGMYWNLKPTISIAYPTSDGQLFTSMIGVNFTTPDANDCWWTKDGGITNTSISCGGNITGVTWAQGNNTVNVYANSSTNAIANASREFNIDTTVPQDLITYPASNGLWFNSMIGINYTTSDLGGLALTCKWSNDSGINNHTLANCGINITSQIWQQGSNNVTVFATDIFGIQNSSTRQFNIDTLAPNVTLNAPLNNTYSNNTNQTFIMNLSDIYNVAMCYQEFANVSTSCGGLATGFYDFSTNLNDGDWGTYYLGTGTPSDYSYVNYTTPSGAMNTSLWEIKDGPHGITNLTLPIGCWNISLLELRIGSSNAWGVPILNKHSEFDCYNGTGWQILLQENGDGRVYEEAMIWNILQSTGLYNATLTINNQSGLYNQTSITFGPGIFNYIWQVPVYLIQGLYTWSVIAIDNVGNVATSVLRNLGIITTPPILAITYPTNTNYNYIVNELNYTTGTTLGVNATCWYALDGGTNVSITCGDNVTGLTANQGTNVWQVFTQDNATNTNHTNVTFFVDSIVPNIVFVDGPGGTTLDNSNTTGGFPLVYFNITSNDTNVYSVSTDIYNSSNYLIEHFYILAGVSGIYNKVHLSGILPDGTLYFNATATDTIGNTNKTETRKINIDSIVPTINITSPIIIPYILPGNNITLNYTIFDIHNQTCYYVYNHTNYSIVCDGTWSQLNETIGINNLTIYANDSFGNSKSSFINWSYDLIEDSQTYNLTTYETKPESFILNLTYDTSRYPNIGASFNMNGTYYPVTQSSYGNNIIFTSSINIPIVNGDGLMPFNWNITMTNATASYSVTSPSHNMTIYNIGNFVTLNNTCGAGFTPAYYFDYADETSRLNVTGNNNYANVNVQYTSGGPSSVVINKSFTNVDNFTICLNSTAGTNIYINYGEIQYGSTGFTDRRFYLFQNTRLTNITSYNTLYLLNNSLATSFMISVQTSEYTPLSGYFTSLMRWYPEINQYKVVEMGKTDNKGNTVNRVKTETVDYRIGVYATDGTLIDLINPVRMVCLVSPCTYTVYVPSQSSTAFYTKYGIQQSLTFNSTTKVFTFTWSDPSQTTTQMNLTVLQRTAFSEIPICSHVASGFTGILTCDVSSAQQTGSFEANVFRSASPATIIGTLDYFFNNGLSGIGNGTFGLFAMLLIAIAAILMGVYAGPVFAIVFGIIALIPAMMIGAISIGAFVIFVGLAIIALYLIRRFA